MGRDTLIDGRYFDVPEQAQEWMMQMMGDEMLYRLHAMLDTYRWRVREMMTARLRAGYEYYGSTMYNWGDELRLTNILEELADAAVYMVSGPLPESLLPEPVV